MQYILSETGEDGVSSLALRLAQELSTPKRVLWLVSGGSNIAISIQVMNSLSTDLSRQLSIMPVDERYGPIDHVDSNWGNLMKAGFEPKLAHVVPVLQPKLSFKQTISFFEQTVEKAIATSDCIIGQFGIGDDGHIAGILPGSAAATETKRLVTGYHSAPYERITWTFPAIKQIHVGYTFVFGKSKARALENLETENLTLVQQPAQILKQLPEAYVYNDQRGDLE